jgi:hypothetical protein
MTDYVNHGWDELIDGNMVGAVYNMFNTAMGGVGWPVVILFFVYQAMLYYKTKNLVLCFITGAFFVSLYATSIYVEQFSVQIMFILMVFELAGILYVWMFT